MSAQHTPGPWAALDIGEVVAVRETADGTEFIGIALINGADTASVAEDEANARLIAAAPELYEALVEMVDLHAVPSGFGPEISRALAALAKARGETPPPSITKGEG